MTTRPQENANHDFLIGLMTGSVMVTTRGQAVRDAVADAVGRGAREAEQLGGTR